ncbi:MAG TPA: pyridoxal phosphate-dependent aminotransferase [Jiangellaceae bacterium]|nr:pyridoxal phosphate-dependent aminotransferase [Jiangellaceae bacterium]
MDPDPLVRQSHKLATVRYDPRGPVLDHAHRLEAEGRTILKLNIGNPAPFGFDAPPEIMHDLISNLPAAQGYGDSKGLLSARRAIVQHYETRGVPDVDVDEVFLGNGVSELITMSMQALLDGGDEVLVPAPDYPLWTASIGLAGGSPVHYRCDEQQDWQPDLADLEAKITPRTKGIVLINPNNPTGAVYSRSLVEQVVALARKHGLIVFADEIYDKILYDEAEHTFAAAIDPDVIVVTFNGLSKAYRVAGFRAGWMMFSGPTRKASNYLEGLNLLANMRLCANVPAQYVVQTALGGRQSINDLLLPGGRLLRQRDVAHERLNEIPGVSCVQPKGAIYAFPRLDPAVYQIDDDEQLVIDLLLEENLLIGHGSGFNWTSPDHVRIVTLPDVHVLEEAIERLARFLERRRRLSAPGPVTAG